MPISFFFNSEQIKYNSNKFKKKTMKVINLVITKLSFIKRKIAEKK